MARIFLILSAVLALSACRVDEYYAEGVSVAARDQARVTCEAEAQRRLPERIVIRHTPRQFHPGHVACNAAGQCTQTPPHWTGGTPYNVDLNEDQRAGAVTSCMASRGYTLISLPTCPQGVAATTVMAPLSTGSCILNRRQGGLIVTP